MRIGWHRWQWLLPVVVVVVKGQGDPGRRMKLPPFSSVRMAAAFRGDAWRVTKKTRMVAQYIITQDEEKVAGKTEVEEPIHNDSFCATAGRRTTT